MASINDKVLQIRQAMYGKDVRESIASGIEAMNAEVESTTARQNVIDSNEATRQNNEATRVANEENRVTAESTRVTEFNQIKSDYAAAIQEGTVLEVTAARHDNVTNTDYANLGARLDAYSTKFGEITNEITEHKADNVYQTAGGTATAITLDIKGTLINGYPITFIAAYTDSNTVKTINGKHFYKPGTTASPSTVAGKAYTVWYNSTGDCFFIKASAEGDASVGDVLAGKKFSNDNDTGLVGTLDLSLLTPTNLRKNIIINGITGNLEPRGYAEGSFSTDSGTVLSIRGLSFKPKVVVIFSYGYSEKQAYNEGGILNDARYTNNSVYTGSSYTCTTYNDGFDININRNPGTTYYWRAWY